MAKHKQRSSSLENVRMHVEGSIEKFRPIFRKLNVNVLTKQL
jgi:hypothetical protein